MLSRGILQSTGVKMAFNSRSSVSESESCKSIQHILRRIYPMLHHVKHYLLRLLRVPHQ